MAVSTRARHILRTVGALLLGTAVAFAPALTYAQHAGGGGGGHFGGGAHFGGGGGAHFSGGGAHFSGGGAHFAPSAHYGGFAGGGAHFAAPGFHGGAVGVAPHVAGFAGGHFAAPGVGAHGFVGHPGAAFAHGNAYWGGGHYWYGGYWHGVFWPHVWFNPGFAWYLPILPLGYATFWWGGLPYYYYNNLYYTWNPGYNGYVVSDPPPVAGDASAAPDTSADPDNSYSQAAPDSTQAAPASAPGQPAPLAAPMGGGSGSVYIYPRNGQSDSQTQNDRYECHSWAVNQTGFDPTRPSGQAGTAADYKRAMIACLDARGYSAR
jgi:hypothetical protein